MRKLLVILPLMLCLSPLPAVVPIADDGGRLIIKYSSESNYALLEKALKDSLDLSWYEKYTTDDPILINSTFTLLSSLLPFENFVMEEEKNNAIRVISLSDGTVVSFTFKDGLIHAVSFS